MFSGSSYNYLRKNGRRIKIVYRTSERLNSDHVMKVASALYSMYPNKTFRIKDHISVGGMYGNKYECLAVHVKEH
jgi:hypothetical protein